ncbi:nitroreductase family deazaflavin-dependent oxidoreductase [Luedemannella helvata]|uniref:Nitroreductase family deazaflavin-dependent oxidoreductase n=1 Tax=Luedemannella helvata TaxID=349315 RepID=A0ABN2KM50_9ACTN
MSPSLGVGAVARRLGRYRWFGVVGRAYVPLDRLVARLTRGRATALGLPSLLLTTTGRRSGEPRTQPLLYVADGDDFIVIGSNWGQTRHPAWTANLLAQPAAVVDVRGRTVPVRGELVTGEDRDELWALLLRAWPAYATYADRAGGRELRIFRLRPAAGG